MKGFRYAAAMFLAMVLVIAMPLAVLGEAVIDEDGNIIEENVEREGGVITLDVALDFEEDFDFGPVDRGFVSFPGQVVETELEGFISVQNLDGEIVNFRIGYQTYFAHGEPEVGDYVIAFYDANMPAPMIYPPQFLATAIVIADEGPPLFVVANFGLDLVSLDGRFRLNIGEDTEIFMQDGRVVNFTDGVMTVEYTDEDEDGEEVVVVVTIDTARKMLVEYTLSHRDFPETLFPERITVLFEIAVAFPAHIGEENEYMGIVTLPYEFDEDNDYMGIVTLPYEFDEDEIPFVAGEIDWSMYDVVVNFGDRYVGVAGASARARDSILPNYVSLRPFVQFFGESIARDPSTRITSFINPNPILAGQIIEFRVGETGVTIDGAAGTLSHAPVLVGGTTYVHLSFFREALGFDNAFFEGGIVTINNIERIE